MPTSPSKPLLEILTPDISIASPRLLYNLLCAEFGETRVAVVPGHVQPGLPGGTMIDAERRLRRGSILSGNEPIPVAKTVFSLKTVDNLVERASSTPAVLSPSSTTTGEHWRIPRDARPMPSPS